MGRFTNTAVLLLAGLQLTQAAPALLEKRDPPAGLRGPSSLLGYAESNGVSDENTDTVKYVPAKGQNDNANIGAYLDFTDIDDPQPIRGTKGGTAPFDGKSAQVRYMARK